MDAKQQNNVNFVTFANMLVMAVGSGVAFGVVLLLSVFLMSKSAYAQEVVVDASLCYISEETTDIGYQDFSEIKLPAKESLYEQVGMNFILGLLILLTSTLVLLMTDRLRRDSYSQQYFAYRPVRTPSGLEGSSHGR